MSSVYIKIFGCSLNKADSERMAGILSKAGFKLTKHAEDADLILVNTCIVKQPTQTKILRYLESLKPLAKPVVVAGCVSQATPELLEGYSMIGTTNLDEIVSVVEETLNGNTVTLIAFGKCEKLSLPRIRKNPVVEILPISEGCLGNCSYCIVKRARGDLRSYPPSQIVSLAKKSIAQGAKEIWITAQDTGCYGKDIGTNLPELLKELTQIEGDFFLRIGMMNPNHAKEFLEPLMEAFQSPKVFKFLHIPVQSGNNEILKSMNRSYTVEDFRFAVEAFRKRVPDITVSTDIICGFPGESKEQFTDSLNLIKLLKPDVLNISRFWPRPGTPAESMEPLQKP